MVVRRRTRRARTEKSPAQVRTSPLRTKVGFDLGVDAREVSFSFFGKHCLKCSSSEATQQVGVHFVCAERLGCYRLTGRRGGEWGGGGDGAGMCAITARRVMDKATRVAIKTHPS